ncbi:TlpA family protein disulfide reductase [Nafulsella turpanensis]|uniref:TlpA family protein disulfide reductase n=1 Tax=Nafulsella turpanensis TaxID=1265690 RepID=UPI000346F646|nr:TlpA disulfide reductase family protein [Nafulsella turpanensis]
MKKTIFSIFLLMVATYVIAQEGLTVTGTISKPAGPTAVLLVPNPLLPSLNRENLIDTLDASGSFAIEVELKEPTFATFRHGREISTVYLEPGKDFSLSLNPEQFDESLKYSGDGAAANNFMAAHFLKFEDPSPVREQMKSLDPEAFKEAADARRKARLAFLETYKGKVSEEFYKNMKQQIAYEWGGELLSYPSAHAYFNGLEESPALPAAYQAYEQQLPLMEPSALALPAYQQYMYRKVRDRYSRKLEGVEKQPQGKEYINGLYTFAGQELKGEVLEYFRHKLLFEGMSYDGLDSYADAYQQFIAGDAAPEYKESLQEVYKRQEHLMAGKPAPNFKLATLEGGEMSLEELKGKVVYVDFWASWCRPCLGEMPAAKKMKEHFKDNPNVAFVYISIDDDENSWREMVEKQAIEGIHLYSQGWGSQTAQDYVVQAIPRYVLIDQEGKLIDSSMSRPSDPATIPRIEEALASGK